MDILTEHVIRFERLDLGKLDEVKTLAAVENHPVVGATHLLTKKGEIAGYVSLGAMPYVHGWLSTKKVNVLDTMTVINAIDGIMIGGGHSGYLIALHESSPMHCVMERFGFVKIQPKTDLFLKEL